MIGDILQPTHLLLILLVALLVLGPKRLPEVGRSLGKGLRDFRGAMAGIEEHANGLMGDDDHEPSSQPVVTPAQDTVAPVMAAAEPAVAATVQASPAPVTKPAAVSQPAFEPDPSEYAD